METKHILSLFTCMFILNFYAASLQAQDFVSVNSQNIHKSYNVEASDQSFTTLVLPDDVKQLYISNTNITAFVSDAEKNVVLVQATKKFSNDPNLTVLTESQKLYDFNITYNKTTKNFVFTIPKETVEIRKRTHVAKNAISDILYSDVLSSRNNLFSVSQKRYGVKFSLLGSYIHADTMLVKLRITNTTNLKYDIDNFALYVRDNKNVKSREARTKMAVKIIGLFPETKEVGPKSSNIVVLAFEKIVIANKKSLFVDLSEKNGDRALSVPIRYNSIKYPIKIK